MKKSLILTVSLFFLLFCSNVSAATSLDEKNIEKQDKIESTSKVVDELIKGTHVELIDANDLPEGTKFIEFESVQEIEELIKEYENYKNKKNDESISLNDLNPINKPFDFSTMATDLGRVSWMTYDPLKVGLPNYMYIDFTYDYYGSGDNKRYTDVYNITSRGSVTPYTTWVQTASVGTTEDQNRSLQIKIQGYFVLGIKIGNFEAGMEFPDEFIRWTAP